MANETYSVTNAMVAARFFPQIRGGFGTNSNPSGATVTTMIAETAADVNGILSTLGIDRSTIDATGEPQSFAWLQYTVMLGTAFRVARGMASCDTDVAKELTEFTRSRIQQETTAALLAQANQIPGTIVSLIK